MNECVLEHVGPENIDRCGIGCVVNRMNPGYNEKVIWLRERFPEGLRSFLFRDEFGMPLAFLEYVPGEYAWRPVDAEGWLFIHCLWVYTKGLAVGGLGGRLIQACVEEARKRGARGVTVMTSDGPWMAGKGIFLKHGFVPEAAAGRFQLLIHRMEKGPAPRFREIRDNAARYHGLHLVYAAQCPLLTKSVTDLKEVAAGHDLDLTVTVLTSAEAARNAPSHYGVYSLIWNGRLLSDHYVSAGRFKNIIRKEILKAR